EKANKVWDAFHEASKTYRESNGLDPHDPKVKQFEEAYWTDHQKVYATLDDVVQHIDHAVHIAGIDHVGIGSDFDGVGDSLPEGLKDVSAYPNLIRALLEKGYSEQDIEKICGGNILRVWSQVEAAAGSAAQPSSSAVSFTPSPRASSSSSV